MHIIHAEQEQVAATPPGQEAAGEDTGPPAEPLAPSLDVEAVPVASPLTTPRPWQGGNGSGGG